MSHTPNTKNETPDTSFGGFTLLEIMIAIFIFSVVITTIVISYRSLFGATGAIESHIADSEMARDCLERIRTDLRALYAPLPPEYQPSGVNEDVNPFGFFGESDMSGDMDAQRIGFTSLEHVPKDGGEGQGLAQIWYYLQRNDRDTYHLRRSDHLYPFPEFEERATDPIVCDHIQSLTMTFIDGEGSPLEAWNSESGDLDFATPRAVHIKLEMGNPDDAPRTYESRIYLPVYREPQG